MTDDPLRVLAGDCTVTFETPEETRTERGHVTALVKPDNTVLVHDADGYRPVAWLTRADAVACSRADPPAIHAQSDDRRLRVTAHAEHGFASFPASPAGVPVGTCPDCAAALVRTGDGVACTGCRATHGLPADAVVTDGVCDDCGLPRMRVERGRAFELCVDRTCDALDDAVADAFDREWSCPDCGDDLRILRRGGLLAGCAAYPDCEVGYGLPQGTVVDDCGCGLPVFETPTGRRCLDAGCEAFAG